MDVSGLTKQAEAVAVYNSLQDDVAVAAYKRDGLVLSIERNTASAAKINADLASVNAEITSVNAVLAVATPGTPLFIDFTDNKVRLEFRLYTLQEQAKKIGAAAIILAQVKLDALNQQITQINGVIAQVDPLRTSLPA